MLRTVCHQKFLVVAGFQTSLEGDLDFATVFRSPSKCAEGSPGLGRRLSFLSAPQRGNVLAVVVVVVLLAAILGFALVQWSLRSARTGAWSRDHLGLRLAAESVAEEVFLRVGRAANVPGDPVFRALREGLDAGPETEAPLPALEVPHARAELKALETATGDSISMELSTRLRKRVRVSDDPIEHAGLVRTEVTLSWGRRPLASRERLRCERAYRVARTTPPPPLDQIGFFLALPGRKGLTHYPPGVAAFASVRRQPHTLLELVTTRPPEGLKAVPPRQRTALAGAMRAMAPGVLAVRAQYVTTSAAELGRFLASRLASDLPVNGVVHNTGEETVQLTFPAFRGRCLLSFSGPVQVGDVRLADRSRDLLTIVSAQRLIVAGRHVEAALVGFNDTREGIVFSQRAEVFGALLTTVFPAGMGLTDLELGNCRLEHNPALDSGAGSGPAAQDRVLASYVAAFSPHPVAVEHARDREAWSRW